MVILLILFFAALLAAFLGAENLFTFWVVWVLGFIGGTVFAAAVKILLT